MKIRTMQILLVLTGLFLGAGGELYARKIPLIRFATEAKTPKISPLQQYFSRPADRRNINRGNKLLILLVEFQQEITDDPLTTGDGTFVQDAADFPGMPYPDELSLAKPPHNQAFFALHAEALKYYYYGASSGSLNLVTNIYPQPAAGEDFAAYQLPQTMSYYHPAGATNAEKVARFEEYFHDVFTEADQDSTINFAYYDHFMIIHAGSDWQHDVNGDTPSDIPSFFIQMGSGKEIYVDDGVMIDHACNIPEMITQDITSDVVNGKQTYFNFGLINAVMAHEFGHSLGFVDLYNTSNFNPGVGYFEIMDNGGSGASLISGTDANYILEGGLPVYPGAWHRIKVWGDAFAARGILQTIDDVPLDEEITMLPAESMIYPTQSTTDPMFIKIPLSDKEYILLENRQVDPDGDGGAYAEVSDGGWVILYPSSTDPFDHYPNYEYDYFLPGWSDPMGNVHGGGILAWHINDKRIYDDGYINADGEFVSNHDANAVNAYYNYRGVRIIEADNIADIGNPSSLYWNGTPYEPFFRYQPVLNTHGYITGWDDQTIQQPNGNQTFIGTYHNTELSSSSHPALKTDTGQSSFFRIYDISSFPITLGESRTMTLKIGTSLFESTRSLGSFVGAIKVSDIGTAMGFPAIVLSAHRTLHFFFDIAGQWGDHFNLSLPFEAKPYHDIIAVDEDQNGESEFLISSGTRLYSATTTDITQRTYPDSIIDTPLWLPQFQRLVVATSSMIYSQNDSLAIPDAQLLFNGTHIIAVSQDAVYTIQPQDFSLVSTTPLPFTVSHYAPRYYQDANPQYSALFVQDDAGKVHRIQDDRITTIFDPRAYTAMLPTQMAIGTLFDDGQPYIVLGCEDRVIAITTSGTLASGFPALIENKTSTPCGFPRIVRFDGEPTIFVPEIDGGYIAVDASGHMNDALSFSWQNTGVSDRMLWDGETLHYFFIRSSEALFAATSSSFTAPPLIWGGKNFQQRTAYGEIVPPQSQSSFSAYAFPNPASSAETRIHIEGAQGMISVKIFDIAGNRIFSKQISCEPHTAQDIRWDISAVASGVYYAVIRGMGKTETVPIAIEK